MKYSKISFLNFLNNESNRNKWVIDQLAKIPQNQTILDAGAGECPYKTYCSHLVYTSQDFGKYDGKGDDVGLQTNNWNNTKIDILSDITKIPVADSSFDNVICTEVLEHVAYPEKVIMEFLRIIKDGGTLILTAPFCSQTHFAPYHFSTGFNIYWYQEILKDNNFKIIEQEINGNYFDYVNQELLRIPFVIKKNSYLGIFGFLLYLVILPLVILLAIVSVMSKGSEKQLCFGYQIVAKKNVK